LAATAFVNFRKKRVYGTVQDNKLKFCKRTKITIPNVLKCCSTRICHLSNSKMAAATVWEKDKSTYHWG